jgi:hypothetical protein
MFVCELHGYNLEGQLDIEELNKTGRLDTQVRRVEADERFKRAAKVGTYGVVKMLQDTDGDGRMDKAVAWATNLPPAYGIVPARGGVIVACAPDMPSVARLSIATTLCRDCKGNTSCASRRGISFIALSSRRTDRS